MRKIIFIVIIFAGILLRLWHLNTLPGGLFLDEVNMAVDAKTLAQNGTDQYGRYFPFYFEDATDFKLPAYVYSTAVAYKVFGSQIITVHITSAIAGILSIFLMGYLAFLLFPEKKYIGYFASTALALSPFAIHMSRIGYETNLALFFLLIYLIALTKIVKTKPTVLWILVGIVAIIFADWTYPAPRFIIPLFTLSLFFFLWLFKSIHVTKKQYIPVAIFLGAVAITFIPTILFPFADTRQLKLIQWHGFSQLITIGISSIRLWNLEFLFDKGDFFAFRHGTKEAGIFLLLFAIPFVAGIFWSIQNVARKNFSLLFLILLAVVAGLPSSITADSPYGTRIVPMLIPYSLLIALGTSVLFSWGQKQKKVWQRVLVVIVALVLIFQTSLFSYIYFVDFKQTSEPEFSSAPVQLATYLEKLHGRNPTSTIYFLADRNCHAWENEGLLLWYFADLPNTPLIQWNNVYRQARYASGMSPFDAYDHIAIPSSLKIAPLNIVLFPGYNTVQKAKKGDIFVTCWFQANTITASQKITAHFSLYPDINRDTIYTVSIKK